MELVEHFRHVQLGAIGDDVGNAVGRQFGEMAVRRVAAEQRHDGIALDVGARKVNFARGIQHDGIGDTTARRDMARPVDSAEIRRRVRGRLAHLGHRLSSDDPGVALERLMDSLVCARPFGPAALHAVGPAAGMETPIQRSDHMTNDMRLHCNTPRRSQDRTRLASMAPTPSSYSYSQSCVYITPAR
jgi:hypothetical protein